MNPARTGSGSRRDRGPSARARVTVLTAAVLAVAALSLAQPRESSWTEKPERFVLASGQTCLYQKDTSSAMTVIELFIPGGKSAVPAGKDGLAFLATRLALEITDDTIARAIMAQATRMRLSVFEDCSVISLECLSENLADELRVASDIIQDPLFSGLRIDNIKKIMSLSAKAEEDDATENGHAAAMRAFYRGTGYGGSTYGDDSSLKALDKKDVTSFYARLFTKNAVFFSVCSDLDRSRVQPLLEKAFARLPARPAETFSPSAASVPDDRRVVLEKDQKQTFVGRAFLLPPATPADYARSYLLMVLLGVGPGSRLWDLRATERLAYNVGARSTWTKGQGVLEAYLETSRDKQDKAVAALDAVLKSLDEGGVTAEELVRTKSLARAQVIRSAEAKKSRAQTAGLWQVLGLGFEDFAGVLAALDAVSLDEMNSFIRGVLDPDKSVQVIVGGKAGT
jgi:predicted Zn-dependent peptidase